MFRVDPYTSIAVNFYVHVRAPLKLASDIKAKTIAYGPNSNNKDQTERNR